MPKKKISPKEVKTTEHQIWNPETGITDLEGNPGELSASEIPGIKAVWTDQRERLRDSTQLLEFTEKLSREWAIETGAIENLYEIDRGVTHTLIEQGFQAELLHHGSTNKPREYVLRLLQDQKETLEGVFDFVKNGRELTTSYIKELQTALLRSQETTEGLDQFGRQVDIPLIKGAWKRTPNYPQRNGVTVIYCSPEQTCSEMDKLVKMHAKHVERKIPSEVQAAWLHHRFTQIHPFQDGNGRVARAIASLILIKDGLFPLVVTREYRSTYLRALEAADNSNLKPLIDLIVKLQIKQFNKASAISETLLHEEDVQAALVGLDKAAMKTAADRLESLKKVFEHANAIEKNLESRLKIISSDVKSSLQRISKSATASVARSNKDNDYYYRSQIIENAKNHIGYFADTSEYRSWVGLNMRWSRFGRLVFTIHGIGKPFNGGLICAPFLEFKDADGEGEERLTFVPIADEGFVFFYNEKKKKLLSRFTSWREDMIKIALKDLTRNL